MFVTGPDVIKTVTHEEVSFEELGGRDDARRARPASRTSRPRARTSASRCIRELLTFLPQNNAEDPPVRVDARPGRSRRRGAPDASCRSSRTSRTTSRTSSRAVLDDRYFFEVQAEYAPNIVDRVRPSRRPPGRHRRQPARAPRGLPRHRRLAQGRRASCASATASTSRIVTFEDVPGFLPGTAQEYGGIIKHGAKLLYAFCEATVPKLTVITRKAYGGAYCVMSSKHIRGDVNFAFPTAEIAVMGPEGAVNIVYRREMDQAAGPGGAARGEDAGVPRQVRQPVRRRRARLHRRGDRAEGHAPEAHPGARDARDQARPQPAEEAREHSAMTPPDIGPDARRRIDEAKTSWEEKTLKPALAKSPERPALFAGSNGAPTERLATPADVDDLDYPRDLGFPGEFPYTRGVQPTMYRGRLWTMRQYAGFGDGRGDQPALPLPPRRRGRAGSAWRSTCRRRWATTRTIRWRGARSGKVGVAISSAARTWRSCSTQIPLDRVSTSMTINATASILLCTLRRGGRAAGHPTSRSSRAPCRTTS